ncbi:hypothetical protein NS220_01165 [Microbacterium testaceum]|uniref:Uncharacterized protein n=2 Tax=Microbacterium testaceum TaxID=2033 RepID=A0A147F165_MICTE|nr:hypothetical protein NS220_01165 [Microbacterium testaceum]
MRGLSADRLFVLVCSFAISIGMTIIAALALTALAFDQIVTIQIPLVATFRGFFAEGGAHAVTVQGSWGGALGVVLLLATPLCAVAIAHRGGGS